MNTKYDIFIFLGACTVCAAIVFWPSIKTMFSRAPKKKRELLFLSYSEADELIKHEPDWHIAPEEDHNRDIGKVYLQRFVD